MANTNPEPLKPQLVMIRKELTSLPEVFLPEGYNLKTFTPGMESDWENIIGQAFNWENPSGRFRQDMRFDYPFRPERIIFICQGEEPVATASAWFRPQYGLYTGYLHNAKDEPKDKDSEQRAVCSPVWIG